MTYTFYPPVLIYQLDFVILQLELDFGFLVLVSVHPVYRLSARFLQKIVNFADCTWRIDENLVKTATALASSYTRCDEKAALRIHIL